MKIRNYHLTMGSLVSFAVLLLMLFPEFMVPEKIHSLENIMSGIRMATLTAVSVAAIRLIIAIPIGLMAGLGSWSAGKIIGLFESVFKILPPSIISLVILVGIFANGAFGVTFVLVFTGVLSLVGWSRPAERISIEMKELQGDMKSKGRYAAGKGFFFIAFGNMGRILKDDLPAMFFDQMAKVLTLIGQLCVFYGLFEGLGMGSNIGAQFLLYWQEKPWLVLCLACAFFIAIFGFNLMAEGLRIRRRRLIENPYDKYRFSLIAIALCIASVLAVMFVYLNLFIPDFSMEEMHRTLDFERTGQLIPGSQEAGERAHLIADELEKIGLLPILDSSVQSYQRNETYAPIYDELIFVAEEEKIEYLAGTDYFADTFGRFDVSGKVFDGRRMDYYSLEESHRDFSGNWVLIGKRRYSDEDIMNFAEELLSEYGARGVLIAGYEMGYRYTAQGNEPSEKPIITVSEELAQALANGIGKLSYRQISKANDGQGVYVLAEIENRRQEKQEIIIIGLSYGWQYEPIKSGKIEFGLELASQLARRKDRIEQTIVFAFSDSAGGGDQEGMDHLVDHMPFSKENVALYIDLTGIYEEDSGRVAYKAEMDMDNSACSAIADRGIRSILYEKDYPFEYKRMQSASEGKMLEENKIDTITIGFESHTGSSMDIEDLGNIIVETIIKLGR
jgi:ABC-type dipeptide/oligopeptide/nickel transport system permease subunit